MDALEAHVRVAQMLLDLGAKPNARMKDGTTSLMAAARNNCPRVAVVLIKAGADVKARDLRGNTALSLALARGHDEVAKVLRDAHGGDR